MSDRCPLNVTQGASSSNTRRVRIYPFYNVLTSTSIFSFAWQRPLFVELQPSNLDKPSVVDIELAYFSDSSAILDLLSIHYNHDTTFCGPAASLCRISQNFANVDYDFENFASFTRLTAVLQLDSADRPGVYEIIPPPSATEFHTSSVFLLQSQLLNPFSVVICFTSRIQAHRQKTSAVATPNHASPFPRALLKMGLIQVLVIVPYNPHLGHAPLTVITSATCNTDSAQPATVLTISINLINHINSGIFYQRRLRSGSSSLEVVFDVFRHINVSTFFDIQVSYFLAPLADVAVCDVSAVGSLGSYVWSILDAKEPWEFLERHLSAHCNPRIAGLGSQKSCSRSIDIRTHTIDKVLNINSSFLNKDYMGPHQDVLLHRALEDVPHVITAWSLMFLELYAQIVLRHNLRNHQSEITTNLMQGSLEDRTFNAIWARGSLLAAKDVSSSVRGLALDRDRKSVDDVKITSSPDMRSTFGSVHFYSLQKAAEVFPSGDVVYRRNLPPAFISLRIPINVPQVAFEIPRVMTDSFSFVEPHVILIQDHSLDRSDCTRRVSTRYDDLPNIFHVLPTHSNRNHLNSGSGTAPLPEPFLLCHGSSSHSSLDLDTHNVNLISQNTAMGTIYAFHAVSDIGRFGSAVLKNSLAIPGIPLLNNEYQVCEDQIIGKDVFEGSISDLKPFDDLHYRVISWMRYQRRIPLTTSVSSRSFRRRICDGHLAVPNSIQQFLNNVRRPPAFQINEFFRTGSAAEPILGYSKILLKPIIQLPKPAPITFDVGESVALLANTSPFRHRQMPRECLKRHLPDNFTPSELFLEDVIPSAVASLRMETLTLATHTMTNNFPTHPDPSQHPTDDNTRVATFKIPLSQLADSIRGHCVDGVPVCPASIYLDQVFVSLRLSTQHICATNDGHVVLHAVEFVRPLGYNERDPRIVVIEVFPLKDDWGTFFVTSEVEETSTRTIHVRGEYRIDFISRTCTKFRRTLPIINHRIASIFRAKNGNIPQRFSTRTIYEVIFPRVVDYNKEYQTILSLTLDPNGMECYASVKIPILSDCRSGFTVLQVFIDTLLHVAGFVVNLQEGVNDTYICSRIGSVNVIPSGIEDGLAYDVYCNHCWLHDQGIVLAEAYALKNSEPPILIARLKGIQFRKIQLNSLKRSVARDARGLTSHGRIYPVPHTVQSDPSFSTSISAEVPSFVTNSQSTRHASIWPACDSQSALHCPVEEGQRALLPATRDQDTDSRRGPAKVSNVCVEDIGEDDKHAKSGLYTPTTLGIFTASGTKFGAEVPDQVFTDQPTSKTVRSPLPSGRSLERSPSETCVRSRDTAVQCLTTGGDSKPRVALSSTTVARLTKALKLDDIPLVLQRSTTSSLPLFLIHDGSGLVSYYHGIPPLGRQVWGINNPKFILSEPWWSVVEMASCYAQHIARVASGPIILGGWSFGGVVAYEASLQLAKIGVRTSGVLLIDSPNPVNHVPLSEELIDSIVNLDVQGANIDLRRLVKTQFTLNADLLGHYDPRETGGTCPPLVLLRSSEGFNPLGIINVPEWLADRSDPQTAVLGWESLAGNPIKVLDIPGHHFIPFKPANIERVCERMMEACAFFEAG